MTLVAASIHDGGITMVADTMLTTPGNSALTRHNLFAFPGLKVIRVSPTLAVELAGNVNLPEVYQSICSQPDDVDATVANLRQCTARKDQQFLVASLDPGPVLWRISNGLPVRTNGDEPVVIGDALSYKLYTERERRCVAEASAGIDDRAWWLRALVQFFVNIDNGDGEFQRTEAELAVLREFLQLPKAVFEKTIGGYLTEITTTPDGFAFAAHTRLTLPEGTRAVPYPNALGGIGLAFQTPPLTPAEDRYSLIGLPDSVGAAGFCIPALGFGIYYPAGEPWAWKKFDDLNSVEDMIERTASDGHQVLTGLRIPNYIVGNFNASPGFISAI